jgi:protein TonB
VYTYVEQMPQLPGGGGQQAIVNEIQKRTRFPGIDTSKPMRYSGIKYTFVVDTAGNVCDVAMVVSSDNLAVDQAILDAVRSLPKLSPGRQDGCSVPVRFTFNIGCILVR